MIVFPTQSCFDDAVEVTKAILTAHPDALRTDEFLIVHGVVAPYGKDFSHAWIEATKQDRVIFIGVIKGERQILSAERQEYYDEIKVKETTKYTFMQAYEEEKRTGEFGPWVPKYRELCGR